ncbi:MAG: NAD(P)/FAD-dependent oxidoreductase [Chlamydiae bacterium]|nr:NAD(P)/FAD-dependent oxidoreductase [Chlamydiota bacterium]MBI3265821.1 NAD(P)/FAD-dependent oxidoreductase [Chlamydiota bacterium]
MITKVYDVIVIGAGPAGTASASFLQERGLKTFIIEKSIFPRDKVCGEFISPAAWKIFDHLGIRKAISQSGYHVIERAVLYAPSGKTLEISFGAEHALGLSRASLDLLLLNHAKERGAEVQEGVLMTGFERENNLWHVKTAPQKLKVGESFIAKNLVLATGREALKNQPKGGQRMLGVKAHYRGAQNLKNALELFFFKEGYGGLVQIEKGLVNACFLLNMEHVPVEKISQSEDELMDWVFRRHPMLTEKMSKAQRVGDLKVTAPFSFGLKVKGSDQDHLFYVGDSLGVIDPFLGDGITLGLEFAFLLNQSFENGNYVSTIHKKLGRRFLFSRAIRFLSHHSGMIDVVVRMLSKHEKTTRSLYRFAHGMSEGQS